MCVTKIAYMVMAAWFLVFIFVAIGFIAFSFFLEVIVKILRFGYRNVPKKEIKYKFWLSGIIVLLMTLFVLWFFYWPK